MNVAELTALIDRLRAEPRETEWLEFKANRYEPQLLGEYLSALANAAGLIGKPRAYLVFGIKDGTHEVVGTDFDPTNAKGNGAQLLPLWLSLGLRPNVGFESHTLVYQGKRLVIFDINPAFDRPVEFYGTAHIRVGTSKTILANHPEKQRQLWMRRVDWSAAICEQASLADLDPEALQKARKEFLTKFPSQADEVAGWDDITFLNKVKLAIQGRITHAALLLLGKPESATLLNPAVAKVSWLLKNDRNEDLDYEHFGPPFLLLGDRLMTRIRNLKVRELPEGTLFPMEMTQYDPWVIREALHNCIAHQDYLLRGRVQVVETPDALILTNLGGFLPGSVEGRYPNLVVAAEIAAATGEKARHIRDKGLDNRYYQEMILELIRTHQPVTREDVDAVLLEKLPEVLSQSQKLKKIHNMLYHLSHREKRIRNTGSRRHPQWILLTGENSEDIEQKNHEIS